MRNLNKELEELGLPWHQITHVLQWVNTLTNQDLEDNGSPNAYFPAGHGDVTPDPPIGYDSWESFYSLESQIKRWIEENLPFYKEVSDTTRGRIEFVKDIKRKFELTLVEAKSHLDKNW